MGRATGERGRTQAYIRTLGQHTAAGDHCCSGQHSRLNRKTAKATDRQGALSERTHRNTRLRFRSRRSIRKKRNDVRRRQPSERPPSYADPGCSISAGRSL
jgi:hypothetical protein